MESKRFLVGGILIFLIGILAGISFIYVYSVNKAPEQLEELENYENSVQSTFVAIDEQGAGVTAKLVTEIREGTGLVLVNINNVLADINTQYSARTAAAIASNYTKISLANLDVIYNLKTEATIVGGQSAGTIMAVSTIAALENKTLKQGIIATGSVNPEGEVVNAGGLIAKAQAAHDDNFTLILVPEGLGSNPTTFKRKKICTKTGEKSYCSVQYIGEQISIGKEIGIEVQEVKTVAEAWKYFEL